MKSAKEMFEKMSWSYEYVKGDCSEDTIQCKDLTRTMILTCPNHKLLPNIQFGTISKCIVINDLTFINLDILQAINKQVEEKDIPINFCPFCGCQLREKVDWSLCD